MSDTLTVSLSGNTQSEAAPQVPDHVSPNAPHATTSTSSHTDQPASATPETQTDPQDAHTGLDVSAYEREYMENGALSDASYQALQASGISRDVVDAYIHGQSIVAEKFVSDMKSLAGGDEGYTAMAEWARTNLAEQEVEAYNRAAASGDEALTRIAISGLYARYTAAEGKTPVLIGGRAASSGATADGLFRSTREVVAAMRDERYGVDPAYTRDVERRIARSQVF